MQYQILQDLDCKQNELCVVYLCHWYQWREETRDQMGGSLISDGLWWRHVMETLVTWLALCEGNLLVNGGIPLKTG